jgi:hypothetical protein
MWQYDRSFHTNNLTADAIEENGKSLLLRALNIRRAIAFVGSGVSVAYGRYGWRELVTDIKDELVGHVKARCAPLSRQQAQLIAALEDLKQARNQNAGEILLLTVQLCEQLSKTLLKEEDKFDVTGKIKQFTIDIPLGLRTSPVSSRPLTGCSTRGRHLLPR